MWDIVLDRERKFEIKNDRKRKFEIKNAVNVEDVDDRSDQNHDRGGMRNVNRTEIISQ